jgi:hypothetical protein
MVQDWCKFSYHGSGGSAIAALPCLLSIGEDTLEKSRVFPAKTNIYIFSTFASVRVWPSITAIEPAQLLVK